MNTIEDINRPVNLGVPNISTNVEKILSIPLGFRVYKDINIKEFKVEIEECYAKLRINKQYENEEDKEKDVNTEDSKIITFNNIRATDTKFNKRVYFVTPDDIEFETKSNNLNIELTKGVKAWIEESKSIKYSNLNDEKKKV